MNSAQLFVIFFSKTHVTVNITVNIVFMSGKYYDWTDVFSETRKALPDNQGNNNNNNSNNKIRNLRPIVFCQHHLRIFEVIIRRKFSQLVTLTKFVFHLTPSFAAKVNVY